MKYNILFPHFPHLLPTGHVHLADSSWDGEAGQLLPADVPEQHLPQAGHVTQHLVTANSVESQVCRGKQGERSSSLG